MHCGGQPNGVADNDPCRVPATAGRSTILKQEPAQMRAPQARPGERTRTERSTPSDEMARVNLDPNVKKGASGIRYVHLHVSV